MPIPDSRFPIPLPHRLEGQFEWQVHTPRQLAHLFLREIGGLLLRLDHRDKDEVLEHLDVRRIHDGGVDLDLADLPFAIGLDRHHSAAGRRVDSSGFELILDLLQPTLHLLRLLQDLHDVGHRYHASLVERPKATRRSRRVASASESSHSGIAPLEESVQKLEIERVDGRSEYGIALPKRRDALLADLLLSNPLG